MQFSAVCTVSVDVLFLTNYHLVKQQKQLTIKGIQQTGSRQSNTIIVC